MKIYLIAKKLSHSFSPLIHQRFGLYSYDLKELAEDEIGAFLSERSFDGLNVTIPYKQAVIKHLGSISEEAEKIGAVNTICNHNGELVGYNTDYYGFCRMVEKSGITLENKKVLVIGSGGASKTVIYAAKRHGAAGVKILTHKDNVPEKISQYSDAEIIVNTSPVGMFPDCGESPVNLDSFPDCGAVIDLIYNPARTQLLLDAQRRGIAHTNGLSMLVAQAERACEIFTGTNPHKADEIEREIRALTTNIVLVGMPGCGKTTVGKTVAEKLGKQFYDIDEEIEKDKMSPADMIRTCGEQAFRIAETEKCREICKKSGCVIATGGGVVTVPENEDILRQNSTVIFIDKPICALDTQNRPLSEGVGALERLQSVRLPLYRAFCDAEICGSEDKEETVRRVIAAAEGSLK